MILGAILVQFSDPKIDEICDNWLIPPKDGTKMAEDGSCSRLGALKIASRCPDTDRREVRGRWSEHISLAMAPGKRHLSKNIDYSQ